MTTSYYRIQNADRDAQALLDPEQQWSYSYNGQDEDTRHGISACDSLESLADYIAASGVEIDPHHSVIVELAGPLSDDEPVDAGEYLVLPDTIVTVTDADEAGFFALVDAAYDRLYS